MQINYLAVVPGIGGKEVHNGYYLREKKNLILVKNFQAPGIN